MWLEQKEMRSGQLGCGEQRRPYTKQRAYQETPTSSPRADARISAVRSGMGEEVWEEAWHKGRAMSLMRPSPTLQSRKRQAPDPLALATSPPRTLPYRGATKHGYVTPKLCEQRIPSVR